MINKKIVLLISLALLIVVLQSFIFKKKESSNYTHKNDKNMAHSIYDYKVKDIQGEDFDFSSLRGKKVMIVNTASKCGLTPQYKNLQALYEKYKDNDFVIVGFPANNFRSQEPGSNQEIYSFCESNYGVTFPMMAKISVRGKDMAPIYHFLTDKEMNGFKDSKVKWNFQKYLINNQGELVRVVPPTTLPDDKSIVEWIKS